MTNYNDELFKQECETGHQWERYVAAFLRLQGLDARVKPQEIRDHVSEATQYKGDSDLVCEGVLAEVKSRALPFHTPHDFPYGTILVDTRSGWQAKDPQPKFVLCVSQVTGAMIWLPASTQDRWSAMPRHDHVRGIEDVFFEAPRQLWQPVETLVTVLRGVKRKRT